MFAGVLARSSQHSSPEGRQAVPRGHRELGTEGRSHPRRDKGIEPALESPGSSETEEAESVERDITHWSDPFFKNIFLLTLLVYGVWLITGCLFYVHYDGFTWSTAFYFAVEAGLAIGFCQPGDIDDPSKIFTLFFVLAGTSVVSGCMATVILRVLSPGVRILVTPHNKVDSLKAVSWPEKGAGVTCESATVYCRAVAHYVTITVRCAFHENKLIVTQLAIFFVWMGLGCIYGMLVEKWTFITSLYWAVTGSSGGGLQSAPCDEGTGGADQPLCDMGHRGWIMGVFFIGGVPFYAMVMGNVAFVLARHAIDYHNQEMVRKPINYDEFLFTANLLSAQGHLSTSLNRGEFILLQFMRQGIICGDQVVQFREQFMMLDKESKGVLELVELEELGIVTKVPSRRLPRGRESADRLLNEVIFPESPTSAGKGGGDIEEEQVGAMELNKSVLASHSHSHSRARAFSHAGMITSWSETDLAAMLASSSSNEGAAFLSPLADSRPRQNSRQAAETNGDIGEGNGDDDRDAVGLWDVGLSLDNDARSP